MSVKKKVMVSEILNVVGTDMFQIMKHSSGFPFAKEVGEVNRKLLDEFPDALSSTNPYQEFVSEELENDYIQLVKQVQEWEKKTGHKSVIQLVKTE